MNRNDPSSRRTFLMTLGSCAALPFIAHCGREPLYQPSSHAGSDGILIRQVGVLRSDDLVAGKEVTLYFREPYHKHALTLSPEQLDRIAKGEMMRVTTAKASGHDHTVQIDPASATTFDVTDVEAFDGEDRKRTNSLAKISKSEILAGEKMKVSLSGKHAGQSVTLDRADLCALQGGVTVYVDLPSDGEDRQRVIFDPRHARKQS